MNLTRLFNVQRLSKQIRIQLAVFATIALVSVFTLFFVYLRVQSSIFGLGRYTVTVQLTDAGDLYPGGNVTYRGVEVGRVESVDLTGTGAEAVLSLNSDTKIPSGDVTAEVHSVSAIGENYVALSPHSANGRPLKDGDVIPADRASIPPNVNALLDATNRGLNAVPRDNLKTVVDESYAAVGGLGPELSRLVSGLANLSIDAHKNLDSMVSLIDQSKPVLDAFPSDSVEGWASHLATVTSQLKTNDTALGAVIQKGAPALDESRALLDRLQPTLPIVLANLVSVGDVAITYRDNIEALLVLLPRGIELLQGATLTNRNLNKLAYHAPLLSFNLNLNLPPPCTTGFIPAQQQRPPSFQDAPERPPGSVYCRIPQDSNFNVVRGARNYPCETRPGKRAATVKLCESDQPYIPLNDGWNWKGDPNATFTGQSVPQLDPGQAPPAPAPAGQPPPAAGPTPPPPADQTPPPIAAAEYDPTTGTYTGPDGQLHTQTDLARGAGKERTWQQMLVPQTRN
jgi:phospholipid/cholesterol/gamma-HCH transport system substrate-binding protein